MDCKSAEFRWFDERIGLFLLKLTSFVWLFILQVPSPLNSNFDDVRLMANTGESVTLTCVASYTPRRPLTYEWYKDGTKQSETSASLTIQYSSTTDIYINSCARKLPSAREVQCNSTYQCAASLSGIQDKHSTSANVLVTLSKREIHFDYTVDTSVKDHSKSANGSWSLTVGLNYHWNSVRDHVIQDRGVSRGSVVLVASLSPLWANFITDASCC